MVSSMRSCTPPHAAGSPARRGSPLECTPRYRRRPAPSTRPPPGPLGGPGRVRHRRRVQQRDRFRHAERHVEVLHRRPDLGLRLDPASLTAVPAEAASKEHAAHHARKVGVEDMRRVDMVVCGSVAVNRRGTRLGKGAGYSDIEVALLQEAGLIGSSTVIVTTVHPLQVIDEVMPETEHDFSVDLIVTPGEVIECEPQRRPSGLYWNHLTKDKIAAIPVLAARAAARRG